MTEIRFLKTLLDAHLAKARRSERGASVVEWVIITAVLALLCLAVYAIIKQLVLDKANSIDLGD